MERAVMTSLRRCIRNGAGLNKSLSCVMHTPTRQYSIAASSIPQRTQSSISSLPTTSRPRTQLPHSKLLPSPRFSSSESTPQGTIGSGSAGVSSEASRVQEAITAPEHLDEKEKMIWELLMKEFDASTLQVQDISGGCGSMYGIEIVSERFRGLGMLKQQRLVNEVLGEEIKGWHGVQLKTRAP